MITKTNKQGLSRPRFRLTKRSGRNLRRHPRALKLALCKSGKLLNPHIGCLESYFEPQRIDDRAPRRVSLRASLKDLYGIRKASLTGSTVVRASAKWSYQNIDRRLDVLLHRAGLTNSINHARQRVSHGFVYGIKNSTTVVQLLRPGYIVCLNEVIYIDATHWSKVNKRTTQQWSLWPQISPKLAWRTIPSYLEVDYVTGSFVLVNNPTKHNVLVPAGLGKTRIDALYNK
jgi:ribosomal protein S4